MKTTTTRLCVLIGAFALLPMLSACNRETAEEEVETPPPVTTEANDAVRVTEVDVGRSIGADKRINENAATD